MEEVHKLHKDVTFGWCAWLRDAWAAQARARHDHAIAVWGDGTAPGARANDAYQLMRNAWGQIRAR